MKKYLISFFVLVNLLSYKCESKNFDFLLVNDTSFFYYCYFDTISISEGIYKISVISCMINDSTDYEGIYYNQIPINQTIIFYRNDTIINFQTYNSGVIFQKISSGKIIPMQETDISEIGIVGKENNILFSLHAGCDYSEYNVLYNTNGLIETYSYYNGLKEEDSYYGDLMTVLKKYDIDYENTFRLTNYPSIYLIHKPPN